jgi:hypothetical protein
MLVEVSKAEIIRKEIFISATAAAMLCEDVTMSDYYGWAAHVRSSVVS